MSSRTIDPAIINPADYVFIPGVTEVSDIDLDETVIHNAVTGERVTEADVEAEAECLERTRPWLIPGGKSLSGDGSHSPVLRLVVPADTASAIKARAAKEHMSVSKWLRRLVERELADAA